MKCHYKQNGQESAWSALLASLLSNARNRGSLQIHFRFALSKGTSMLPDQCSPINAEFIAK